MTVCHHVSLPHKNTILSKVIGAHIFALRSIKHRTHSPLQGDYGNMSSLSQEVTGCSQGGAWQQAAQIWDLRLTRKTIATSGAGAEAKSQYFSLLFFTLLSLLSRSAFLSSPANREGEGHLPRGRIIHCPWSQRKQSKTQRQRSLPFSTVPHPSDSHIAI